MNLRYLPFIDALMLFALFAGSPAMWAVIGYFAWKGKPDGFDREKFGLSAVTPGVPAFFLLVYSQRMHADFRTPSFFLQLACFLMGVLLWGIAGGCMLGIFVYRRGLKSPN